MVKGYIQSVLTWLLTAMLFAALTGCGGGSSSNNVAPVINPPPSVKPLDVTMFNANLGWPEGPVLVADILRPTDAEDASEFVATLEGKAANLKTDGKFLEYRGARSDVLPGFRVRVFSQGDKLIPVPEADLMTRRDGSLWQIIFGEGRIWQEAGDEGFSRAQLTVTLVNPFYANAHNGLLTFLYRENEVTHGWLQIFQENVDWLKQDFWASVELQVSEENNQWLAAETENYQRREANRLPRLDMQSLQDRVSAELLQAYDGNVSGRNLSATGLYFDGALYTQPPVTRYGRFPYPQSMRHGVFSVSKSLAAAVALFHLNLRYQDEVEGALITDYVEGLHQGWQGVTFTDLLSMATGTGSAKPDPDIQDPFADETFEPEDLLTRFSLSRTSSEKLSSVRAFGNYPWGPNEIVRYNTAYTFLLAVGLENFLQRKGETRGLWRLLQQDVYDKLGVENFKMTHTEESFGATAYPVFGVGIYPTDEEAVKVSLLFQQGGLWKGEQLLDPNLTRQIIEFTQDTGLPAEFDNTPSVKRRYHLGFWSQEVIVKDACRVYLPYMLGYGNNYLLMPNNGVLLYRFQDAFNGDKASMMRVSEALSPMCD